MNDLRTIEKIETKLAGEGTRYPGILQAPRASSDLFGLSNYQLKLLYVNLVNLEFIVGSPLGDVWAPTPPAWKEDYKGRLIRWVHEGLEAARRYYSNR
jgi:hypothetical protein